MPAEAPRRHGRRLRALGDAFHRTVKYALRPVDHEAFAELFPGLREALVASLYGMNFRFMPELEWQYGYAWALGLMIASALLPMWYFRRRGWLK